MDNIHHRTRIIGYYLDCDQALKATLFADIYECGYYDTVVIEEVPQGVYPFRKNNQLWIDAAGSIIEVPEFYENTCCIGIG